MLFWLVIIYRLVIIKEHVILFLLTSVILFKLLHREIKLKYSLNNNLAIMDILFWPCCGSMNATDHSSRSSSSSHDYKINEGFVTSVVFVALQLQTINMGLDKVSRALLVKLFFSKQQK